MSKQLYFNVGVILSILLNCAAPFARAEDSALTFAIEPQQSTTESARRWIPIIRYLSEKSGVNLRFIAAKDLASYHEAMQSGLYDIAYINPVHYVHFRKAAGYEAFAKESEGALQGILVARRDGPSSVSELEGREMAFASPMAVAATVVPMSYLTSRKLRVSPHYVVSIESVYRAVAKGLFAAGGGEMRTFKALDAEIRNQLKVIWQGDPLPPLAFAAHPRVAAEKLTKVRNAMLNMHNNPDGARLLRAANAGDIVSASDADFAKARSFELPALEQQI